MNALVSESRMPIVNGPGATKWLEGALFLLDSLHLIGAGFDVEFTLTTPGSANSIKTWVTVV